MMPVLLPMGKTAPATQRRNVPAEGASMKDLAPEVSECVAILSSIAEERHQKIPPTLPTLKAHKESAT